jgi:dephospho-CoA kinase
VPAEKGMATQKLIIGVTGMPGCGKGELYENYFKPKGIPKVYMGKPVKDEMLAKGIETTSDNVRAYATRMREKHGYDIVMRLCVPQINEVLSKQNIIVIEDIKGQAEVDFLRSYYESPIKIVSVAILASPKTRYARAKARPNEWDQKQMASYEDFLKRDRIEGKNWGIYEAIACADYYVINEGSLEELIRDFDLMFEKILADSKIRFVLGLIGTIGAGKDTVADYLMKKYGFTSVSTGDLSREELRSRGIVENRENTQAVSKEMSDRYGLDYWPKKVAEKIKALKPELAMFNGVRRAIDVETMRNAFGDRFKLLLIDADANIRLERMKSRNRPGDPQTLEEFLTQEKNEFALFGTDRTIAMADYKIKNESDLETLYAEVDKLMKELLV